MRRISSQLTSTDMQYQVRQREWRMNEMQNKIAGQSRIKNLRDDPIGAAHAVRFQSHLTHLARYSQNTGAILANNQIAEGYISETVDIMQRIRELAIQGAHGTYAADDLKKMGVEVDQLLRELVEAGNARNADGTTIFSGTRSTSLPFQAFFGSVPGGDGSMITEVQYSGSPTGTPIEISKGVYVDAELPGSQVFWAEPHQIYSRTDASAYQVPEDTAIFIDGQKIDLKAGDTIGAVIAKINDSAVSVKAQLDPVQNSLSLTSTTPHLLSLQDAAGGTVLQDLGILAKDGGSPPHNLAVSARSAGGSVFDVVMQLRNTLMAGNSYEVGGKGLAGLDRAMESLTSTLATIGAKSERLEFTSSRLDSETLDTTGRLSSTVDVDMTEAITEYKMLEYSHKAALSITQKILSPSLLDFMR